MINKTYDTEEFYKIQKDYRKWIINEYKIGNIISEGAFGYIYEKMYDKSKLTLNNIKIDGNTAKFEKEVPILILLR